MIKAIFKAGLIIGSTLISLMSGAQSFQAGQTNIEIKDASRSRTIPVSIYYPADKEGKDVSVSVKQDAYPYIIFGHGLDIPAANYEYIARNLVPHGFIIAFPLTESDAGADPDAFAADMRFVYDEMKKLGASSSSVFYKKIGARGAIGGHSMGGGCSMQAAANNSAVTCVFSLAPAHLFSSASNAVKTPLLIFAGDKDCATPVKTNQQPIYEAATSACKALVILTGANHCQFAATNSSCEDIESSCGGTASISHTTQQERMMNFLLPFLQWHLNNYYNQATELTQLLDKHEYSTVSYSCKSLSVKASADPVFEIHPNPSQDMIHINIKANNSHYRINDISGRTWDQGKLSLSGDISIASLPIGTYNLEINDQGKTLYKIFIKH